MNSIPRRGKVDNENSAQAYKKNCEKEGLNSKKKEHGVQLGGCTGKKKDSGRGKKRLYLV